MDTRCLGSPFSCYRASLYWMWVGGANSRWDPINAGMRVRLSRGIAAGYFVPRGGPVAG